MSFGPLPHTAWITSVVPLGTVDHVPSDCEQFWFASPLFVPSRFVLTSCAASGPPSPPLEPPPHAASDGARAARAVTNARERMAFMGVSTECLDARYVERRLGAARERRVVR